MQLQFLFCNKLGIRSWFIFLEDLGRVTARPNCAIFKAHHVQGNVNINFCAFGLGNWTTLTLRGTTVFYIRLRTRGGTEIPPKISWSTNTMTLKLGTIVSNVKWWRYTKNDVIISSGPEIIHQNIKNRNTLTKHFWPQYFVWSFKNHVSGSFSALSRS